MSDHRQLLTDLGEMQRRAHNESLGQGVSAKPKMMEFLANDLRFKEYDHSALADAADNWFRSGPRPNLDDPSLKGRPNWSQLKRV